MSHHRLSKVSPRASESNVDRKLVATICLACLAVILESANAGELVGRVVKITDGDTLTVLVAKKQIKVRLTDIDAPERRQPFGTRSRQSLAELCAGKDARVAEHGEDRYGRTLGRVYCAGVDSNAEQTRRGMAWVYAKYATKDSPLYDLQREAQAMRRGLWTDPKPMPPWEWRRGTRGKGGA